MFQLRFLHVPASEILKHLVRIHVHVFAGTPGECLRILRLGTLVVGLEHPIIGHEGGGGRIYTLVEGSLVGRCTGRRIINHPQLFSAQPVYAEDKIVNRFAKFE